MRRLFYVLAIGGVGCYSVPPCDYISNRGVCYIWRGAQWEPRDIEAQEAWFTTGLAGLGYDCMQVSKALHLAVVAVMPGPVPCYSADGTCRGVEFEGGCDVEDLGAPGVSALTHELAHWVREQCLGDPDHGHTDTALWALANGHP